MYQSEPLHLTANFYLPNENGPDVILEVVTKENPMTIERSRKIEIFRYSGYKVLVWYEEEIDTSEKLDLKMTELLKLLGRYDEKEMKKYESKRRETYREVFGNSTIFSPETKD